MVYISSPLFTYKEAWKFCPQYDIWMPTEVVIVNVGINNNGTLPYRRTSQKNLN